MNAIELYNYRKETINNILCELLAFINDGGKYGLYIDPIMITKIENAINDNATNKMKIVLIGGFSEGKTTIAAAVSERYDPSSMKISQEESSDEIEIYDYNDEYLVVDTPGLFGYKEDGNKELYKEKTKKYISESDLVIYVMSPDNPIKESHKRVLKWLFGDLNLLPRTVFVLNRFDDVVDLEDDEEFNNTLNLRRKNVLDRLNEFGIIRNNETVPIVAVSANPYNRGIDEWLKEMNEFKKLSRIDDLINATTKVVEDNGGKKEIVLYKQQSIIGDILNKSIPEINNKMHDARIEIDRLDALNLNINKELKSLGESVSETRISLNEFIISYFEDLILQNKSLSLETIDNFFEREIGDEGIVMQTRIQNEFDRQVGKLNGDISSFSLSTSNSIDRYNSVMENMAIEGLKKGGVALKNCKYVVANKDVLKVRDLFFNAYKFKPWQAIKIADCINKGIPILGSILSIGIDAWQSFSENKKKQELENVKNNIEEQLVAQRKMYIDLINDENLFEKQFFPNYVELKNKVNIISQEVIEKKEYIQSFEKWKSKGEYIDAEFKKL